MDRISRILIGLVATCFVIILITNITGYFINGPISRGILAVPGYEHAVLICGDNATDEPTVTHIEPTAHILTHQYGFTTVNWGHLEDPQVGELERIAKFACGYKKMERPWIQRFIGVASHNHFIANTGDDVVLEQVQLGDDPDAKTWDVISGDRDLRLHMEGCDQDFNAILIK